MENLINVLKPGDRIIVKAGFGFPTSQADRETVVAHVDGNSALTVDAIRLCQRDEDGISIQEKGLPVILSPGAREMLAEAGLL